MRYYTFDHGFHFHRKPATAAAYAIAQNVNPRCVEMLENGQVHKPERWEVEEVEMHVRDQRGW